MEAFGWVGWCPFFLNSGTTLSAALPSGSRQTNNAAELTAVVQPLQLLPRGMIANLASSGSQGNSQTVEGTCVGQIFWLGF